MDILTHLKYILIFLLNLIKVNPAKIIFLIISIISFNLTGYFNDVKIDKNIIKEIKIENEDFYISRKIENNSITYSINKYNDEDIIEGNKVSHYRTSNIGIFTWTTFIVSILLFVVMFFLGLSDDSIGWEFNSELTHSLSSIIYCVEKNDVYYYMSMGRLITKRSEQLTRNGICYKLGINSIGDIYFCPKYDIK